MKVLLYGASGHGKVISDIIKCIGQWELLGFIDDDPNKVGQSIGGLEVVGTGKMLHRFQKEGVQKIIVSIGSNAIRTSKADVLKKMGFQLESVVHPSAVISSMVKIGTGTVVMANAVINPGASIGSNVIINTGATVDHDCVLEEGVHVSPGGHLAGYVRIGREAHIGIGASVVQGILIGEKSIVGAGSVVIHNVPPGKTVVGNPARELRK